MASTRRRLLHFEQGAFFQAAQPHRVGVGNMGEPLQADRLVEAVDLVGLARPVGDDTAQPHVVVLRLGLDRRDDAVHRKDRVEIVGRDDQRPLGMLQRRGEAAAHHVAQHVEDHHVGVFEKMVLLEQLDGLPDDVAAAAGPGRRTAGFDTHCTPL